jgi:predicted AAA+ superfamily ATPase
MINRHIINALQGEFYQPEVIILLGPRQVGKTTILKMLEEYARGIGKKTAYFDLEQPQTLAKFNRPNHEIIELFTENTEVIFIDEFQYIENISKIFKAIFDSQNPVKIFCTGSSSLEIHSHLKESLAGRRILYRIFPLRLSEIRSAYPEFTLSDYLVLGGMPGLTNKMSNDRKQLILNELLSSYILKDVKSLVKEENIRAFNHLLYLLAQYQGSVVGVHSLATETGVSSKTVNRYLDILENTYVNFRVYSYSTNLANELKKSFKTYFYDTGIRNALLKDFSLLSTHPDKGCLYESFVFLKLLSESKPNTELHFWRTKEGHEVDFILLKDRKPIPIEVKSAWADTSVPGGLRQFIKKYPVASAYVVNENVSSTLQYDSTTIRFCTFDKFETILI